METASHLYEDVVLVYARLIRQVSEAAADAIEQIQADFGSHAALRAALIITVMTMEVQQNDWIPNVSLYGDLLSDYPDALKLTKYAITCCLEHWAGSEAEVTEPEPFVAA